MAGTLTLLLLLLAGLVFATAGTLQAGELVLASKDAGALPIIVAKDAPAGTRAVAETLAGYIDKISGVRPAVLAGAPEPVPERAIWVGWQPALDGLLPGVKGEFAFPEETLIAASERYLVIAGRDRWVGEEAAEHGTAQAVYSFLQNQLGVRWLWPGPLGEDVPRTERLAVAAPLEKWFHPPFRFRNFWPRQPVDWQREQHLYESSLRYQAGHGFTTWWEQYAAEHPDYFALLPNGQREPQKLAKDVKLCTSNPGVAAQWLANAEVAFRQDPARVMMSATPNDSAGFCVCPQCRAQDHPDGPPIFGYVSLTDRHVKFWNTLARGLAERLPGREAWVGAYAYSAYRFPPIAEKLEPNIAIGYVGAFPTCSDEVRREQKEQWLAWAKQARAMVYRPNLFHYSGGFLGLPTVSLRSTIEDFRFLAEHQCIGIDIDSLPLCWATQGVQYYLMAQLAYEPLQDGDAVLRDYYARGFGPAAGEVAAYFAALEAAHGAVLERIQLSSAQARAATEIFQQIYTPERWQTAEAHLAAAEQQVAAAPEVFRRRLDFLRTGFEAARHQVEILRTMKLVRDSGGKDKDAIAKADTLCAERDALYAKYPGVAMRRAAWYIDTRKMADYIDPPNEAMRNGTYIAPRPAKGEAAKE